MCNKRQYDVIGAQMALARIAKKKKPRGEKRYYYCRDCLAYHLTSQSRKHEKRRK